MATKAEAILTAAVEKGTIPCAAYAIGRGNEIFEMNSLGYASLFPEKETIRADTRFDMASLTKLLSTTMVALKFIEDGKLLLSDPLSRFFTKEELANAPEGRASATVFHLMTHTSGITPHIGLWREIPESAVGGENFQSIVAKTILDSAPFCGVGEQVHYSCMGYILLQQNGVHSPATDPGTDQWQTAGRAGYCKRFCTPGHVFHGVSSLRKQREQAHL